MDSDPTWSRQQAAAAKPPAAQLIAIRRINRVTLAHARFFEVKADE